MDADHPAFVFAQCLQIPQRRHSFEDAKRVRLARHRKIGSVIGGQLQEQAGVRPTFVKLAS